MPRYGAWAQYVEMATRVSLKTGVARELLLATAAIESAFKPDAYREEKRIKDASRGLMQTLLRTARSVGFTGEPDELFDPEISMLVGGKVLRENLLRCDFDMPAAVSMYNGGYRPKLGMGRRATNTIRLCLAWSQTAPDTCLRWHVVKPGDFGNQPYVDKVLRAWRYFTAALSGGPDVETD